MALTRLRFLSSLLAVVMVFPFPGAAFETPLSDTAVREAYFLGQRHDDSLARFFDKYTKHLPRPKNGPYVSSVAFFTPFALAAERSSRRADYSAQQAQIDHREQGESVRIVVQFELPAGSGAAANAQFRPRAFWNDYEVQIFDKDRQLKPANSSAEPNYLCSEDGGCILTGATLSFEFSPDVFTTDDASVNVVPPEGDPLIVEFDLSSFR